MQLNTSALCSLGWLLFLCFGGSFTETQSKCKHDRHRPAQQRMQSTKKYCDPSYNNQTAVTQKCSSGFYREWAGAHRGLCVPCSCNGFSRVCDERTGSCVNCQNNTSGERCEWCKEGHYRNAANWTCPACPCPSAGNNFALACMDVGSGAFQCLCKRGYIGARCERCAFGYYGNPVVEGGSCRPCSCKDTCNSLTGECYASGESSCGDHCHESDSCTLALLADLEKMDDLLTPLKQQLQNISNGSSSPSRLNHLENYISETRTLVGSYSSAVRHLDPELKQLEADVEFVRDDLSYLIDKVLETVSDLEKGSQNEKGLKRIRAGALLTETHDLTEQHTEEKPGESAAENNKTRMMEEAQGIVQEMRESGCSPHRDKAGGELKEAHALLDIIRKATVSVGNSQIADSFLREVAELLSDLEDKVNKTRGLNLEVHLHTQLEREQSSLLPVTEMTKDILKNVTIVFLTLEKIKEEFASHAAALDGAKPELIKKLNNIFQTEEKRDDITETEEKAEELNSVAAQFQHVLHDAMSGAELLSSLGIRSQKHHLITETIEKADIAANQSKEAAEQALKDMKEGGLNRAEGLRDNSTGLGTEANETLNNLKSLSHRVNVHKDRVNLQKEKGDSLGTDISTAGNDIKKIKRISGGVPLVSVNRAASASNAIVSRIAQRLAEISQEMETIPLTDIRENADVLIEAEQALNNLNGALPALKDKITHVEALSGKSLLHANMTEGIRRIKDVIEETRSYIIRLSVPTTFNGRGHVELHPPRNLKDIKAFTAVDLLLNRHQKDPPRAEYGRKRRQDKRRDASFFVFYLGNEDASGDYIGMAIRNKMLVCVYKLGGEIHEVETSQITTTTNVNSPEFDRVVFHRVYQDAEVNITQNFTSQKPVAVAPRRYLPNTTTGILNLDPDSIVFYVGGYPQNFTPPVELNHPKYRGAMKLSYINDNPVCLFNYKRAVGMAARQPIVKISRSEMSDYYDGTGYRMVLMKEPHREKIRLFKFRTKSQETDALLFYIGNQESFFCVFLERGFLVLQGRQTGRVFRRQSYDKVSLFAKYFGIIIADTFVAVHYSSKKISVDHKQTSYGSYYIGGLPAPLRQRHNITAPPLRGCVDHLTANAELLEYNKTIGVSDGCPVSLLDVCLATQYSALSVDSLFDWEAQRLTVSLGFKTTDRYGTLLSSSSQGSTSVHNLQLSLADGYAVFKSDNYTMRSDERYSNGRWHYLTAVRRPTGLELSVDNIKVTQRQSQHSRPLDLNSPAEEFTGCITNLYIRRPEQSFTPVDLSLFALPGDLGQWRLLPPAHLEVLRTPDQKKPPNHKLSQAPAGSQCQHLRGQHEYKLSEEHSWLSYTLPQEDLNYRPHFSLNIKTNSSKGLILHVAGRGVIPLLALYLANGKIKMLLGQNRTIQHKQKSNDGNWHRVQLSVEKSTFHLLVDGVRVTDGHLPNDEGSFLDMHNPVYLGADPMSHNTKVGILRQLLFEGHGFPVNSVVGCIRDFKMNEQPAGEPEARHRSLPCLDRLTEMGTYFGGGYIILDEHLTFGSQFELTFELRPQYLTGLLFHVDGHETSFDVFLNESEVGVNVNEGVGAVSVSVAPTESLCDGKFHTVTVSKQLEVIKLVVDSMSEQKAAPLTPPSDSNTPDTLYIGGTAKPSQVSVSSPFVGCLRNVELNGRSVAFKTGSSVVGFVNISRCPAK